MIEGIWKLINFQNTESSSSIQEIKQHQNDLINRGLYNLEISALVNQNIRALSNPHWGEHTRSWDDSKYFGNNFDQPLDTNKIIDQTNFPLKGNWGDALGLTSDSSTWTKSDFASLIEKLFDKNIMRVTLYESYGRSGIEARGSNLWGNIAIDYTGQYGPNEMTYQNEEGIYTPLTFSTRYPLESEIEIDGKKYKSSTSLIFEKK